MSFRAADWKLDAPDWMGRMRVTAKGKVAYIKLEDKISGSRDVAVNTHHPAVTHMLLEW